MNDVLKVLLSVIAAMLLLSCDSSSESKPRTDTAADQASSSVDHVQRYAAEQFFTSVGYSLAGGHAWSFDDSALLTTSDKNGTFNVYAMNPKDGSMTALTESTDNAHRAASWFPADNRILFARDQSGDELDHVFVREVDGEVVDLTPGEGLKAQFTGWSDSGSHFFVLSNERDAKAMDLYRYQTGNYNRELVFENDGSWFVSGGSRDERYLVLLKAISNARSQLYLLDREADDSSPVLITPSEEDVSHTSFTFTPDGKYLIYGTDEHGEFVSAWQYELATGEHSPYFAADWDLLGVSFTKSGQYRNTTTNEDGRFVVSLTSVGSGQAIDLAALPNGGIRSPRFSRDETKLAMLVTTDTSPRDIYTVELKAGTANRLTSALNPEIEEADLVGSEVVRYPSFDGLDIPGILFKPHGANADNRVPAVVLVHGGPGGQSRPGYSGSTQHLANHGIAVFAANNRGSSGYGKTFYHMDDLKHGEVDLDDIVYAQKYLASLDWVDADRIGIMGGSYGGYMVGAALAFRPEVFKVGVNIFGVMNWVRTLQSIPAWWGPQRDALFAELGDPETDLERLERISPLFHASNIKVPLLVVQGANDPRVLQIESDEIVAAVRDNDVPVEYLVFPDEGHGFSQRANRIAASEAYVRFLNQYLG
ncbi:MAG: prolyl oligopeptidase family serine peptidase [Pseudomonadales bacterium]|nr:prolyl oligopeptidase family serine peptidase [Pseudomonadales bacterium]